jgi:uncharacterized protein
MMQPIPLDGPIDLAALDDFLASDRAPPGCMQLSELDGFLAGIVAGPELIPPSAWLPMIWHEGEPDYADVDEMQAVLGTIVRRYNEIIRLVDSSALAYRPVLVEQEDGSLDASDWALGFLQAMAVRQNAWDPLMRDSLASALIIPIMLIASTTERANLPLDEDERLPDDEMAKLLAQADKTLCMCVTGMRTFFNTRRRQPGRRGGARSKQKRRR